MPSLQKIEAAVQIFALPHMTILSKLCKELVDILNLFFWQWQLPCDAVLHASKYIDFVTNAFIEKQFVWHIVREDVLKFPGKRIHGVINECVPQLLLKLFLLCLFNQHICIRT